MWVTNCLPFTQNPFPPHLPTDPRSTAGWPFTNLSVNHCILITYLGYFYSRPKIPLQILFMKNTEKFTVSLTADDFLEKFSFIFPAVLLLFYLFRFFYFYFLLLGCLISLAWVPYPIVVVCRLHLPALICSKFLTILHSFFTCR